MRHRTLFMIALLISLLLLGAYVTGELPFYSSDDARESSSDALDPAASEFRYPESFKSDGYALAREAIGVPTGSLPFSSTELATLRSINHALEKKPADITVFKRVLEEIPNSERYAPFLTPYILRYVHSGGVLRSGQQQFFIAGLAANGAFDDAEKYVERMSAERFDSIQTRYTQQDILYFRFQKARQAKDLVVAAKAFIQMNDVNPNGQYQWRYDETMNAVLSLINTAISDRTFTAKASSLDALWPYLPHSFVKICCDRATKAGLELTSAMQAAQDPLFKGSVAPPAALIRRGKYSWSRLKNLALAYEQDKAALTCARQQQDKRQILFALIAVSDGAHQHGELEVEMSAAAEALVLANELRSKGLIGEALLRTGLLQEQMSDYKAALQTYRTIGQIVEETDDGNLRYSNNEALSRAATHVGSPIQAESLLRGNVELAELNIRMGSTTGARLIPAYGLGTNLMQQGRYSEAIEILRRPMPAPDKDWCALLQLQIGRCYLKMGDGQNAQIEFSKAQEFENAVKNPEVRWAWQAGKAHARVLSGDLDGGLKGIHDALATIESQRASLKDYHLRRTLQNNKHDVYDLAIDVALKKNDSAGAFSFAERSRARAFLDLMGSRSSSTSVKICTEKELSELSRDFSTIVLFEREFEIVAWITEAGKTKVLRIPFGRDALRRNISALYDSLFKATADQKTGSPVYSEDWRQTARTLHDRLWKPLEEALSPNARVCLIPHGTLHYLPFQVLFDGKTFAIERHELFYAASASSLVHTWKHAQVAGDKIAILDPILSDDPSSPFAKTETQDLARLFPNAEVVVKKDATLRAFERLSNDAGLLHISSHGSVDTFVPLHSALIFQPSATDSDALTADKIYRSHFPKLGLVVMSACVSSVGEMSGGDEVTGMTRAFQAAGAQNAIGSLWPVENEATAALMLAFYRSLKEHPEDPTSALSKAQRERIKIDPHPRLWAAFLLSGRGKIQR